MLARGLRRAEEAGATGHQVREPDAVEVVLPRRLEHEALVAAQVGQHQDGRCRTGRGVHHVARALQQGFRRAGVGEAPHVGVHAVQAGQPVSEESQSDLLVRTRLEARPALRIDADGHRQRHTAPEALRAVRGIVGRTQCLPDIDPRGSPHVGCIAVDHRLHPATVRALALRGVRPLKSDLDGLAGRGWIVDDGRGHAELRQALGPGIGDGRLGAGERRGRDDVAPQVGLERQVDQARRAVGQAQAEEIDRDGRLARALEALGQPATDVTHGVRLHGRIDQVAEQHEPAGAQRLVEPLGRLLVDAGTEPAAEGELAVAAGLDRHRQLDAQLGLARVAERLEQAVALLVVLGDGVPDGSRKAALVEPTERLSDLLTECAERREHLVQRPTGLGLDVVHQLLDGRLQRRGRHRGSLGDRRLQLGLEIRCGRVVAEQTRQDVVDLALRDTGALRQHVERPIQQVAERIGEAVEQDLLHVAGIGLTEQHLGELLQARVADLGVDQRGQLVLDRGAGQRQRIQPRRTGRVQRRQPGADGVLGTLGQRAQVQRRADARRKALVARAHRLQVHTQAPRPSGGCPLGQHPQRHAAGHRDLGADAGVHRQPDVHLVTAEAIRPARGAGLQLGAQARLQAAVHRHRRAPEDAVARQAHQALQVIRQHGEPARVQRRLQQQLRLRGLHVPGEACPAADRAVHAGRAPGADLLAAAGRGAQLEGRRVADDLVLVARLHVHVVQLLVAQQVDRQLRRRCGLGAPVPAELRRLAFDGRIEQLHCHLGRVMPRQAGDRRGQQLPVLARAGVLKQLGQQATGVLAPGVQGIQQLLVEVQGEQVHIQLQQVGAPSP
ncbi:hypothetical protein OSTOST_04301 [Ostertagia ostertagi]